MISTDLVTVKLVMFLNILITFTHSVCQLQTLFRLRISAGRIGNSDLGLWQQMKPCVVRTVKRRYHGNEVSSPPSAQSYAVIQGRLLHDYLCLQLIGNLWKRNFCFQTCSYFQGFCNMGEKKKKRPKMKKKKNYKEYKGIFIFTL